MTLKTLSAIFLPVALGVALSAQAHDPKEHMKNAEQPKCEKMKNMDHSKMDMNDPVMQAMMKKCMKHKQDGDAHHKHRDGEGHDETVNEESKKEHSEHQH